MVNKKKKTKTCDKVSQDEDWISKLPDVLISDKILSHLSTEDSVRTSALSTKWRNLWKWVPGLELDSRSISKIVDRPTDLDAFVNFIDRFLDSQKDSWIRKLKLNIHDSDGTKTYLSSWFEAVTKRKIQELDVSFFTWLPRHHIPLSIYTCETLVQLRLCYVSLVNVEFVSLPCLKILHLENLILCKEATIEKIILGSPVLEDLTIKGFLPCKKISIQVRSKMLKRISIDRYTKVEIDAPLLQFLKTEIFLKKNFKIISSGFPDKVDIYVFRLYDPSNTSHRVMIRDILADISKARELVINDDVWKNIFQCSKYEELLKFRHLSCLTTRFHQTNLEMLLTLLENCPNLESLILELYPFRTKEKEANVMFSTVPRCLVSSLKFVRLKRLDWFPKYEGELKLVRYLLKNSNILEKLRLDNYHKKKGKCDILKELLAMPRCSGTCEILVP